MRQDIEQTGGVEVIGEGRGREKKRFRVQSKGVGHWVNREKIFERDTEDNRKKRTVPKREIGSKK